MSGYLLRPCKSTAAFEAIPNAENKIIILDLDECQSSLENIGYEEVCNVKVLIIMKKDIEVTIYPNGKLILKSDSEDIAKNAMNEIYTQILKNNVNL